MNAPTHIRFTHDESAAIDAYANAHGLRKASAVRELLKFGLAAVDAAGNGTGNDAHELRLQRLEETLTTIARLHGQQLDSIIRHLSGQPAAHPDAAGCAKPESA